MLKSVSEKLYLKSTIKRINYKVRLIDSKINIYIFLNLRLFISLVIFGLTIYLTKNILLALLLIVPLYIIIEYFVFDTKIKKRNELLEQELVFYLDMLIISYSATLNFKKALEITTENVDSNISKEFKKVLKEINLGKTSNEALTNMMNRIDSNNIKNILFNIKETITYGNNPLSILKEQREYLNKVILINAKYHISKLPLKIITILVLLFIPLIILFLFAPIIIDLL